MELEFYILHFVGGSRFNSIAEKKLREIYRGKVVALGVLFFCRRETMIGGSLHLHVLCYSTTGDLHCSYS